MTRICDASGCPTAVNSGRFMCYHHWCRVPTQLQRTINARYRANPGVRDLLRDAAYLDACARAIEHLAVADGRPAENSYRRAYNLAQEKLKGVT